MRRFELSPVRGLLSLMIVLGFVSSTMAFPPPDGKGGGNGGGGGEEPPPEPELPPIIYEETVVPWPEASIVSGNIRDINDAGNVAGSYWTTVSNQRRAYLYTPAAPGNPIAPAVDLNTLNLTWIGFEDIGEPWVIREAMGVNENGLVVGFVSTGAGANVGRRGYVLDLATMEIYSIPDGNPDWTTTHPLPSERQRRHAGDIYTC